MLIAATDAAVSKRDAIRMNYFSDDSDAAWCSRAFVRKPHRTAPLQRRLAWLRQRAVARALQRAMSAVAAVQVVSLGAGLDWALLSLLRRRSDLRLFEVDLADVVAAKRVVFDATPDLRVLLTDRRDDYALVACDLNEIGALTPALTACGFRADLPTAVLAEGVLQLLEPARAAAVLAWVAALERAAVVTFGLCVPNGSGDAVVQALSDAMRSRSMPVHAEPLPFGAFVAHDTTTLDALWHALDDGERRRIVAIEPFDEHEDWLALSSRFAVTLAVNSAPRVALSDGVRAVEPTLATESRDWLLVPSSSNSRKQIERVGASLCALGDSLVVFGGFGGGGGQHNRLDTVSVATYAASRETWTWRPLVCRGLAPSPRQFHAAVALEPDKRPLMLSVGGRSTAALGDVFVLDVAAARWVSVVEGGVRARFRHTLTRVGADCAIAMGGRDFGAVLGFERVELLRLRSDGDTLRCAVEERTTHGDVPLARFAHAAAFLERANSVAVLGGLDGDERALSCAVLHVLDLQSCKWRSVPLVGSAPSRLFGHTMHAVGDDVLWVVADGSVRRIEAGRQWSATHVAASAALVLTQHCSAVVDARELVVVGGGAAGHTNGCARLLLAAGDRFAEHAAPVPTAAVAAPSAPATPIRVVEGAAATADEFEAIVARKEPVIFRGLDFGRACELWTPEHLRQHGGDVGVSAHVCATPFLDFQSRNYRFESMSFAQLIDKVFDGDEREFYYLRSVGDNPRKDVADVFAQWPALCDNGEQLRLPECMRRLVAPNQFSSVFRVASAGTWVFTHYDVCDNVLFGIRGAKRVVLFAPRDVGRLYVDGSTSRIVDVDSAATSPHFPRFAKAYARRLEAVLQPGDILYIPALWFHTTKALDAPAVGVNLFWRDPALPRELLSTRDLYGNVDPTPAANLLQTLAPPANAKAPPQPPLDALLRALDQLPPHYRNFYARKFAAELKRRLALHN